MTIEKLDATTPDLTPQNVARLAELFPECVTEGPADTASDRGQPVIDFDLLRQALADHLVEGPQERYRLDWPGKRQALLTANAPIDKTLRPMRGDSVEFDTTRNLFIEGDNLDALKLLQETYLGKVKMIYIDPPYNTGGDFIYRDNFSMSREEYEVSSGQRGEGGGRLVANPETNGRFHSDWLSMMYPRLKLARNLLKDDGVIFVSIDDNELSGLHSLCVEIFGESNFVATLIWQKVYSPKNSARWFSEDHDYIVVFAKDKERWVPNPLPRTAEMDERYRNLDNDPRGAWKPVDLTARNAYADGRYPVTTPSGRVIEGPPRGRYWSLSKKRLDELDQDGRIWWGADGSNMPAAKRFLSETSGGRTPQTLLLYKDVGHTQDAKKDLLQFVDFDHTENVLNSVKSVGLLRHLLQLATESQNDDVVLDFFGGSATTAHAVLKQNSVDDGNRRFIHVQLPVSLELPEAGFDTIAGMGRNRIANVVESIRSENDHAGVGFRAFRIDSGNFQDTRVAPDQARQGLLDGLISHIKDDRSDEDLLFGALVRWGVDITLPVTRAELLGRTIWIVDPPPAGETGAALIACFARPAGGNRGVDPELADALAAMKPLRVLFRDDGFAGDAAKENVASRFKQRAPDTAVKVL